MNLPNQPVSVICPHCHRGTWAEVRYTSVGRSVMGAERVPLALEFGPGMTWWIAACAGCNGPMLVFNDGEGVLPYPGPSPTDTRIPSGIRDDLVEAKTCFTVHAYRATAVLARRAIQTACLEKGAKKSANLLEQIDDLAARNLVTKDLQDCAHDVRLVGNDGAHPEHPAVDREDAEDVLLLAEQILGVLFVAPSVSSTLKERRAKRTEPKPMSDSAPGFPGAPSPPRRRRW